MFKHILIPVVPETCSESAASMGLVFAKAVGARVTFAYVMTKMDTTTYGNGVLKTWSNQARDQAVICDEMLILQTDHHIGDVIASESKQKDYDLIVMGTHAREGLNRLLLGSVTERVVRLAQIPVLVARAENASGMFKQILVPLDAEADHAYLLETAQNLARSLQAKLHFVHVIPDTPIPLGDPVGAYTAFDYAGLSKSLEEAGQFALENALQTSQEFQPTRTILHANTEQIHALITQTAKDVHADLILMTTHARSGFDRLLLGSVAEAVVHHASVPVFLLRPKAVTDSKAQKALSKTG